MRMSREQVFFKELIAISTLTALYLYIGKELMLFLTVCHASLQIKDLFIILIIFF